jgi:hypothetical protein
MPYPVSAACFVYPNPIYKPARTLIESITLANPAVVTTTLPHNYKTGLIVRLDIPPADGMQQASGNTYEIIVLSPTTFSLNADSTLWQPFTIPLALAPTVFICAFCVPVGEDTLLLNSAVVNTLNPFM